MATVVKLFGREERALREGEARRMSMRTESPPLFRGVLWDHHSHGKIVAIPVLVDRASGPGEAEAAQRWS